MRTELWREPLLAFVALFLLSLVASYVLFKLLDSRASIKRKEWSAGGAIAGFLIILFGSWYALRPTLIPLRRTRPVSVPAGFKPIELSDEGIAIAVPDDWERKTLPIEIFIAPNHQPNSSNAMFLAIRLQSCTELQTVISDDDLKQMQQPLKEMFGMLHIRGASSSESYLGHKASLTPISLVFPGKMLEPPLANDLTLNSLMKEIYDERNGRCITLYYPESELGKQLSSTLNVTNPSF